MTAISHQAGSPDVAKAELQSVLARDVFDRALSEIRAWPGYAPTPLVQLDALAASLGLGAVFYKDEGPRFGLGSFKALGAAYAGLRVLQGELGERGLDVSLEDIRRGACSHELASITLAAATDGNHGRSLAWGARQFGAACRIYVHSEVSVGRVEAIQELGADVIRIDGDYDASVDRCRDDAAANGWFVVSDTSWPGYTEPPRDVMAGYGVIASEVVDSLACPKLSQHKAANVPRLRHASHVFLQAGVGGLAAAVAARLRQLLGSSAPRVCVVEPELAPCLFESARAGRATSVDITQESIMAGLSCGVPSPLAWEVLRFEASDFLTVSDELIAPAVRRLARPLAGDPQVMAGESGVAGLAALTEACRSPDLAGALGLDQASRVLLIGSEGVTDATIHAEIMAEV